MVGYEGRGTATGLPVGARRVGLPPRVFLYTLDQISVMIEVGIPQLKNRYVYFEGRSIGRRKNDLMIARNVSPAEQKPEWRIAEREFVRWMRVKGFRYYEIGGFST